MRAHLAALLVSTACGCSVTEIVVVVDSDLRADDPMEIDRIELSITGPSRPTLDLELLPEDGLVQRRVLSLVPASSDGVSPVVVEATARLGDAEILTRVVNTSFLEGESKLVHLQLLRGCVNMPYCAFASCDPASCVDEPMTSARTLADWDGELPAFEPDPPPPCAATRPGSLAAGSSFTCATELGSGTPFCWGDNTIGQLGVAPSARTDATFVPFDATFVSPTDTNTVVALAAGSQHACAIDADRQLFCWGNQGEGRVGNGNTGEVAAFPMMVASSVARITLGERHSCAVTMVETCNPDGTNCREVPQVSCWGASTQSRLGYDAMMAGPVTDASECSDNCLTFMPRLGDDTTFDAGAGHTCMRSGTQYIFCFGVNTFGQLGLDPTTMSSPLGTPTVAMATDDVTAGRAHTCAIVAGTVSCWGDNGAGQLGPGTAMAATHLPVEVTLPESARLVVAGDDHTCASTESGEVYCWGENGGGQSSPAVPTDTSEPERIALPGRVSDLAAGQSHSCARVETDGCVYCWGDSSKGQLGAPAGSAAGPVAVVAPR